MTSEEITKEIDLRTDSRGKIIHVNFHGEKPTTATRRQVPTKPAPQGEWLRNIDVREPWILRLVAVVAVLILSMLVL